MMGVGTPLRPPREFPIGRLSFLLLFTLMLSWPDCAYPQLLNRGDGVRLTIYNVPEKLSGDYFIQHDWNLQLPLIGIVNSAQRAFEDVRREIITKYTAIYREPEITVQPLYKISILGEVHNPGIYFATGYETLTDILAMAGGEDPDANLKKVYIVRGGGRMDVNLKDLLENGENLSAIDLQSGDQIYVPRKRWINLRSLSVIISGAALLVTLVDVLTRRR